MVDKSAAQRVEEVVGFSYEPCEPGEDWSESAVETLWNHCISECERADRAEAEVERLKKDLSARLEAAEALVAGEKWVRVEDALPKVDEWVHIVVGGITQIMPCRLIGGNWEWWDSNADNAPLEIATHWRRVPAPPSNGKDKSNGN